MIYEDDSKKIFIPKKYILMEKQKRQKKIEKAFNHIKSHPKQSIILFNIFQKGEI